MGVHRSQRSRAPTCAFCVFVTAFAGARGRAVVRRIGLCLGFLAAVAAAFRWVSTLCLVLCVILTVFVHLSCYLILNHMSRGGGVPSVRLYGSGRASRKTTVTVDRYDDRATWIVGAGTHVPTCGWTGARQADLVGAKVSCSGRLTATSVLARSFPHHYSYRPSH